MNRVVLGPDPRWIDTNKCSIWRDQLVLHRQERRAPREQKRARGKAPGLVLDLDPLRRDQGNNGPGRGPDRFLAARMSPPFGPWTNLGPIATEPYQGRLHCTAGTVAEPEIHRFLATWVITCAVRPHNRRHFRRSMRIQPRLRSPWRDSC